MANYSIFWCISEVNIWRCHVNKAKRMHLKIINPWDTKLIVHCTLIYSTEAHYNLKKLNLLVPWPQSSTLCVFLLLHHLQNSPRFGLFSYLYLVNARGGSRIKRWLGLTATLIIELQANKKCQTLEVEEWKYFTKYNKNTYYQYVIG